MTDLKIHVLMRFSKKTGVADKVMTALGTGMLQMWALQNTTKTKLCLIFERDTGKLVSATVGTPDGFPKVKRKIGNETCEDYGIALKDLQAIKDDRFDD